MEVLAREPFRPRPEWNRLGPPVSLWFRKQLERIDPKLVLQFLPVRSMKNPRGVPPNLFPGGVWDICIRLPRSGYLSPVAVWSLVDAEGNFAPPGADTVHLIKKAYAFHRNQQTERFEAEMDRSIQNLKRSRASESKNVMVQCMSEYMKVSMWNRRQWGNRIQVPALRREVKEKV